MPCISIWVIWIYRPEMWSKTARQGRRIRQAGLCSLALSNQNQEKMISISESTDSAANELSLSFFGILRMQMLMRFVTFAPRYSEFARQMVSHLRGSHILCSREPKKTTSAGESMPKKKSLYNYVYPSVGNFQNVL